MKIKKKTTDIQFYISFVSKFMKTYKLAIFRIEKPQSTEVTMELEEDTKVLTIAEARARFDQIDGMPVSKVSQKEVEPVGLPFAPKVKPEQKVPVPAPVPEVLPKKVIPPVKKPTPLKPFVPQEKPVPKAVKSPSPRLLRFLIFSCMA